jgi:hypothetical protein
MAMDEAKTNCPSDEALISFFSRDRVRAGIEALADHVRLCPRCRIRFDALRAVEAEVRSRESEFLALAKRSLREADKAGRARARRGLRTWAPQAAAALLTVAMATAAFLLILRPAAQDGILRSPDSIRLKLISPAGRLAHAPAVFQWSEVTGADSYFFELIDDSLEMIVAMTQTFSPSFVLPPEAQAKMRPGRTYIWSVEARGDDGLKIEAARRSFVFAGR